MNDYLFYLSFQSQIYPAYPQIIYQNISNPPHCVASIVLKKLGVTGTMEEIEEMAAEIKSNSEVYTIDPSGLKFLVMKLQQKGNNEKAELIMKSFKPSQ